MNIYIDGVELTNEEIELVRKHRDGFRGVFWHVDDFKGRAEENKDWLNDHDSDVKYDESKFEDALDRMISNHDAEIGINWDVIDCYLLECKVEDKEIELNTIE